MRAKDKSFDAKLETQFDPLVNKVNIVPQDIGRVFLNLINNAFYTVAEKKKEEGANYEPLVNISTNQRKCKPLFSASFFHNFHIIIK